MSTINELSDEFELSLSPVFRYKPAFALRTGIYSDLERFSRINVNNNNPELPFRSQRDNEFTADYLKSKNLEYTVNTKTNLDVNDNFEIITPGVLIENIGTNISKDISLLETKDFHNKPDCLVTGSEKGVFFHHTASISKLAEIDTSNGPVIIDAHAEISSFSILRGPLYIGKNCMLDKVMISNSTIGNYCRLGGEISDSLVGDYTNKHHEGFLGHSIVGEWVNLGALTTTSDLKNNYGIIHLEFEGQKFSTNIIKFGSIIGDYVKTGIGTMLNTGTIIDAGSLIFEDHPRLKYFEPFFWGGKEVKKYDLNRFLADMEKIMARRNASPTDFFNKVSSRIYNHGRQS